jgi:hypothetical protein
LSSPIFYDYRTEAPKSAVDDTSHPNPILDGALGSMILYDELWFFTESLCPVNLRGRPFVKYLDKNIDVTILTTIDIELVRDRLGWAKGDEVREGRVRDMVKDYSGIVKSVGVHWESGADHHTHGLLIGEKYYRGSSLDADNIIFDFAVVDLLKQRFGWKFNLITNTFTQSWLNDPNPILGKSKLTELLVLENLPGHLSRMGPYHDCMDEVRENDFLKEYRKWMDEQAVSADAKELRERKLAIEAHIAQTQKDLFLKYLDPKAVYKGLGTTIAGSVVDTIIPFASTVHSVRKELADQAERKDLMWQGFVVTAKQ